MTPQKNRGIMNKAIFNLRVCGVHKTFKNTVMPRWSLVDQNLTFELFPNGHASFMTHEARKAINRQRNDDIVAWGSSDLFVNQKRKDNYISMSAFKKYVDTQTDPNVAPLLSTDELQGKTSGAVVRVWPTIQGPQRILLFRVRSFDRRPLDINPGDQLVVHFRRTLNLGQIGDDEEVAEILSENASETSEPFTLRVVETVWGTKHFVNIIIKGAAARSSETQPTLQTTGYVVCEDPFVNPFY